MKFWFVKEEIDMHWEDWFNLFYYLFTLILVVIFTTVMSLKILDTEKQIGEIHKVIIVKEKK